MGFDVHRQRLAREYKRRRTVLASIRVFVYILISAMLLRGFTFDVKAWASAFGGGVPQYAFYTLALYFLFWIPVIPIGVLGGFVLERWYKMSVQGLRSWLADAAKSLAIGLGFSILVVEVLYFLLAVAPEFWWFYGWLLTLAVGVVLTWLGPVVLAPLFNRYEPLRDEALAAKLKALADRTGARVVGVFRMLASAKTTRAFGGLAGIGNTRRIILSDTLLNRYTPDEVETVVAHEIGHHVHHDIFRLTVAGALASLAGLLAVDQILRAGVPALGLAGIADVAGLPLIALTIAAISTVVGPVLNLLSRRWEVSADRFALQSTGNAEAFTSTMIKIHDQNLGVADPHPLAELLFHDHPSGLRRVEAALRWRS